MLRLLFIVLLVTSVVRAAEVVSFTDTQRFVGVSHPSLRKWVVDDSVCVMRESKEIACGLIVKVTPKIGVLKLGSKTLSVARGDKVELVSTDRKPAAILLDEVPGDRSAKKFDYNLTGGISFGTNYFFPMLHFQREIESHFAIGVLPLYFRGSADGATVQAMGCLLTANYYQNGSFRGLWGQLGGGVHMISTTSTLGDESATVPSFLVTGGYRGYFDMGLNIGIAVGLQWVKEPTFTTLTLKSTGIKPLVVLDVGINF